MDILKVLSRGIKPTKNSGKPGVGAATATQLPSAGARPNPQFFHDPVGGANNAKRGKKRKRRKDAEGDDGADNQQSADEDELSDVDFFAPPKPATDERKVGAVTEEEQQQQAAKRKPKLLDEDECKAILRSHRLKLTVLSGRQASAQEEETSGKDKKKSKKGQDKGDEPAKKKKKSEDTAPKKEESSKKHDQIYTQPLNKFGELRHVYGVSPQVADNIARQGFRAPTEVQMGSLPLQVQPKLALKKASNVDDLDVKRGIDFLGVAPTGSGKTISFLIPAIDGILRRRSQEDAGQEGVGDGEEKKQEHVLMAVVVAPTRELASQIVNEGRKLAIGTGVRVVLMKRTLRLVAEELKQEAKAEKKDVLDEGSDSENDEEEEEKEIEAGDSSGSDAEEDSDSEAEQGAKKKTKSGEPKPPARVDILVTTPKILLNFLTGSKNGAKKVLPTVRSLILDEADVLLDPIFRKQTMGIWKACTNPDLSLTCWSATMASNIEALVAKEISKRCKRVGCPPKPLIRLVVGLKDTAVPNITHKLIYTATEQGKLLAIRQLLHPVSGDDSGPPLRPPFIVFTQTIERAQSLHDELKYDIPLEAGGSARVAVLHSSLPDSVRSKIMARFRSGDVWVLITTDVLARGVDFAGVNGIVNYDVPNSAAAYVHRSGRTGRAGREGGVAVTFYTKDDIPFVKSIANVIAMSEKQAGKSDKEGAAVQKWLLDALPDVAKADKRKLKVRGVESRRAGGRATITTKSNWELKRERNKLAAIEASKRRKRMQKQGGGKEKESGRADEGEWGGLDD